MTTTTACGTDAGYQRHRRRGEQPCEDCRLARRDYIRQFRARKGGIPASSLRLERARARAQVRLAQLYPGVFQRLLSEELSAQTEAARQDGAA